MDTLMIWYQPNSDHSGDADERQHPGTVRARLGRGLLAFAALALSGSVLLVVTRCGSAGGPRIPAGMRKDGVLYTSCKLTYTDGVPTGAAIGLYNPGSGPVEVFGIGIEQMSNGILMGSLPVQTPDFPGSIPAGSEDTEAVNFGSSSATACQAGWQPESAGPGTN